MQTSIDTNKKIFISLLQKVNRPGAQIEALIDKLNSSDFFIAPASTKYHGAYEGGLCAHCLKVYENIIDLANFKDIDINEESLIIVALLHDFSKMNYYESYFQNKKVYSNQGSKRDENGYYDWVSVPGYKIKDIENRFVYGSLENTSEYMTRCYIPLTYEESIAISHVSGQLNSDSAKDNIYEIYKRVPLAFLLHTADMMAISIDKE